jgi:hypothetical protein
MLLTFKFLLYAFSLALLSHGQQGVLGLLVTRHNSSDLMRTCDQIAAAISPASEVFFPCERVIFSIGLRYSI